MAVGFPQSKHSKKAGWKRQRASYDPVLEYVQHQSGYKEPAQMQCVKDKGINPRRRDALGDKDL